ncbi:MAG TPA: hypothetical protein VLF93_05205 [Candidatus Saccharimonadales bacterium]|nr:hypothetical protein [Candidatus Saccharimonadales bacterium]
MKTIFLAASMSFYKELVEVEKLLEEKEFNVIIPVSAQLMKKNNDFDVTHYKGVQTSEQKGQYIMTNFEKIAQSDAILVINNIKNGIEGYIGANVLMEIGLAFYLKKNIYIWNPIEEDASYKEELLAFNVVYINNDLDKIQ